MPLNTSSGRSNSELFLHAYFALWLLEFGLLAIVTYTYCLGALFDDRKDRSILFWKSMPISDIQVMLSKIGMALIIGPLITGAVTILTAAAVLLVLWTVAASNNVGNFGVGVFLQMLWHIPMKMLLVMPLNVLWAMPCIGWLLMVSSMARSKPLLWALGTPAFLLIAVEAVLSTLNSQLLSSDSFYSAFMRLELGVFPGSWIMTGAQNDAPSFANGTWEYFLKSFFLAIDAGLWIGVLAGLAMGYVALRKRCEVVEI